MKDLHFIPIPLPEESPLSLLKRAAIRNGYSTCRQFLSWQNAAYKAQNHPMLVDSQFAMLLCAQAGEYAHEVRQSFYEINYSTYSGVRVCINQMAIDRRLIRYSAAAICTDCVRDGWEKQVKDLLPVENCPYHSKKYISHCPSCERKITWVNQVLLACKCGNRLESPSCPANDVILDRKILFLLRLKSQKAFDLLATSLKNLYWNIENSSYEERRKILSIALAISLDEPEKIASSLVNLYGDSRGNNLDFYIAKLNPFTPEKTLTTVKDILYREYAHKGISKEIPAPLTCHQLKIYLGLSQTEWTKIQRHEEFTNLGNHKSRFDHSKIMRIKEIHEDLILQSLNDTQGLEESLTAHEVAGQFKTNLDVIYELKIANLLGNVNKSIRPHRISCNAISNFNENYILAHQLAEELEISVRTLRKVIVDLNLLTPPLPHKHILTTVILKKDIEKIKNHLTPYEKPMHRSPKRSANLLRVKSEDRSSYYNTKEASQISSLSTTLLRQLVRVNILHVHYRENKPGYLFHKDEIHQIQRKYIGVSEAASLLEIPTVKVSCTLASNGIQQCTGPLVDGEANVLFLRSDFIGRKLVKLKSKLRCHTESQAESNLIPIKHAAKQTGLTQADILAVKAALIIPLRAQDNKSIVGISPAELQTITDHLSNYKSTREVLRGTWMSRKTFCKIFLNTHIISELFIKRIPHINKEDITKLTEFTSKYCNLKMADVIMGAPKGHAYQLLSRGLLRAAHCPEALLTGKLLLDRKEIESMDYKPLIRRKISKPINIESST
ncbi:hypothetical protein D9M70_286660 [compost metagenome]